MDIYEIDLTEEIPFILFLCAIFLGYMGLRYLVIPFIKEKLSNPPKEDINEEEERESPFD